MQSNQLLIYVLDTYVVPVNFNALCILFIHWSFYPYQFANVKQLIVKFMNPFINSTEYPGTSH